MPTEPQHDVTAQNRPRSASRPQAADDRPDDYRRPFASGDKPTVTGSQFGPFTGRTVVFGPTRIGGPSA